jgi:tRNA(fMet)-specific endonuclease VapC
MNRYLLDTNIIIFFITNRFKDDVSSDIKSILQDYNNILHTSSVSVLELLQLCRIGKVKLSKGVKPEQLTTIIEKDFNIKIQPFTLQNLQILSKLSISEGHNDPFDHAIIAQAISEKMVLISSDTKFENYTKQKLKFVFNKR